MDFCVLKEFGESLIKPHWEPFQRVAELKVGVFVVDGGKWVLPFSVQTNQDVVLVGSPDKEASEVHLALPQICGRLEGLKCFEIPGCNDSDRERWIYVRLGKYLVKHPAQAFKLVQNLAALLITRIGDDCEVRAADFKPLFGRGESMAAADRCQN
jgi:hypothetical protein